MRSVSSALVEKGVFIMEVPSKRKIPKLFDGHLHYFSEKSLQLFLSGFFEEVKIIEGVQSPALLAICK